MLQHSFLPASAANDDGLGRQKSAHAVDCLTVVLYTLREIADLDGALDDRPAQGRRDIRRTVGLIERRLQLRTPHAAASFNAGADARACLLARRERAMARLRWLVDLVGQAGAEDDWPSLVRKVLPDATATPRRAGVVYDMTCIGTAQSATKISG